METKQIMLGAPHKKCGEGVKMKMQYEYIEVNGKVYVEKESYNEHIGAISETFNELKMLLGDAKKEGYNKGAQDAWDLSKKICLYPENGGYGKEILREIFVSSSSEYIMRNLTPQQAFALMKMYKKEKQKIRVGDIVKLNGNNGIVIDVRNDPRFIRILFPETYNNNLMIVDNQHYKHIEEEIEITGRNIDFNGIMNDMLSSEAQ